MLNRDLTALQTAPAKEIARLVKFYAVVPRGDAGVRYIHKSWTDPRTRKVHVLKRSTGQSNDRDALAVAITHAHVRATANRLGVNVREAWGRK